MESPRVCNRTRAVAGPHGPAAISLLVELAAVLARGYLRLVARERSCGDCSTDRAQKGLEVFRPESPCVTDTTGHGRPRWNRA